MILIRNLNGVTNIIAQELVDDHWIFHLRLLALTLLFALDG